MNWIENFESSNIHSFGWNPNSRFGLEVRFKDKKTGGVRSGTAYAAPRSMFDLMDRAPSKGEFLNREIKGRYDETPLVV